MLGGEHGTLTSKTILKLFALKLFAFIASLALSLVAGYLIWFFFSSPLIDVEKRLAGKSDLIEIILWTIISVSPFMGAAIVANRASFYINRLARLNQNPSKQEKLLLATISAFLASVFIFLAPWLIVLIWNNYDGYCYYGFTDGGRYPCSFWSRLINDITYNNFFLAFIWLALPFTLIATVVNYIGFFVERSKKIGQTNC